MTNYTTHADNDYSGTNNRDENIWTLHETPFGTVAARVNADAGVYLTPAFGIGVRYPDNAELRYYYPIDRIAPGETVTTVDGETMTGSDENGDKAVLRVNQVDYEHVTIEVAARPANDYLTRIYGNKPVADVHSSYLRDVTTAARRKLEAMALELYPTVATPVRVTGAALRQAQYNYNAAADAQMKAQDARTVALADLRTAQRAYVTAAKG